MFWRSTLAFLLIATPLAAQANGDRERVRELDVYFAKAAKDWKVPGLAVAIVHHGQLIFAKGYGVRDARSKEPVDTQTTFAIASTTKALTTLLMARLIDRGELRWATKVIDAITGFRLADRRVTAALTIEHTVCACTGMPRQDLEVLFEYAGWDDPAKLAECISAFNRVEVIETEVAIPRDIGRQTFAMPAGESGAPGGVGDRDAVSVLVVEHPDHAFAGCQFSGHCGRDHTMV